MTTETTDRVYALSQALGEATGRAMEALDPASKPAWKKVGTGSAGFCGDNSPLTQVAWLAYGSDFDPTELDVVEEFYRGRAAHWEYVVTPYADPRLLSAVIQRGWTEVQYENVMGRELRSAPETPPRDVEVRLVGEADRATWADVAMRGFFGDTVPPGFENLSALIVSTKGTVGFLAFIDGEPAGAATLIVHDKTCYLGGAATLEQFRGRGAQTSLLNARLKHGYEQGCDLALCECLPGTQSQRNQERAEFHVLYTKIVLTRPR